MSTWLDFASQSYTSGDNVDGGDFTDYTSGDDIDGGTFLDAKRFHHLYAISQADISTDDIVITGVQVKAQGTKEDYGETILFGSTGYVIEMTNPLIQENTAHIIANSVGQKIVGMRFRPLNISTLSDPSIEAGDVAKVSDRKGNVYHIMITNLSYTVGENEKISCDAETPGRKRSTRYDAYTKAVIESRRVAQQEINAYDLAAQQLNDLVLHSFGVYKTEETLPDGSKIFYSHDKPTLEESQNIWKQTANTFTVSDDGGETWRGMDADGNMVVTVLNAIGINAEWINAGTLKGIRIEAEEGKIANMDITSNGFVIDDENPFQYFVIQVGDTKTEYLNGEYRLSTKYINYDGGTEEEYTANLDLGGNGFNLNFENSDNTYNCGINIYHDYDGKPLLNLYTRGPDGLYDGIKVNDYNLWNRLKQVDTHDGDIIAIKSKLGMI